MRLGQAVCDYVEFPAILKFVSAIVPLTEAQYRQVLEKVASVKFPDDMAGAAIKDRVLAQETLVRAIRQRSMILLSRCTTRLKTFLKTSTCTTLIM
jgi:hypothetical protein